VALSRQQGSDTLSLIARLRHRVQRVLDGQATPVRQDDEAERVRAAEFELTNQHLAQGDQGARRALVGRDSVAVAQDQAQDL